MKTILLIVSLMFSHLSFASSESGDWVDLKKFDFSILQEIVYATDKNFTHKAVYPEARCLLRKPVAEALTRVQQRLKLQSVRLKVWDCYRPLSVQKKFWELVPDERYVARPDKGSRHNRGAAVDVTLVDLKGTPLEMPTSFDDFSEKAHRDFKKITPAVARNRELLENAMKNEGFIPFETEWWHFDFKGWENYPVSDVSFSSVP